MYIGIAADGGAAFCFTTTRSSISAEVLALCFEMEAGIKITGFLNTWRECGRQKIMKCPDNFEQDIFLFGFQFDPVSKSENKELFYILFESKQKRNKFFKQSVWLQEVKHASVWLQVEHASRRIVIQKVFVDLSKICILQYNELKYYPSTFTYRKLTWNPNIVEEFSSARSLSYINDFLLSRPRPKKCNSKHSWKICMDHIAVMELLAIIAEKNPFTYYEQYLFHLSISHIQKCHSNISKIALVAIVAQSKPLKL